MHYNIKIHSLNPEERIMIHNKIKENIQTFIKTYNKTYKRKPIKNIVKKKVSLSLSDKINLAKQYIFSILDIPLKNYYLHKMVHISNFYLFQINFSTLTFYLKDQTLI